MRLVALLAFVLAAGLVAAQGQPVGSSGVIKIRIRHGDPWAIKALLQGTKITQPELSTILGFAGVPDQPSELVKALLGEGTFAVNPTDNSLLFFPKKKS